MKHGGFRKETGSNHDEVWKAIRKQAEYVNE